jgi:ferredoxin
MPSVEIDREACEGSRYCEQIAPQLFRLDDEDKAVLVVDEVPEEQRELLEEAESLCPTFAIKQRAAAAGADG